MPGGVLTIFVYRLLKGPAGVSKDSHGGVWIRSLSGRAVPEIANKNRKDPEKYFGYYRAVHER